jgi:hypothetical protein
VFDYAHTVISYAVEQQDPRTIWIGRALSSHAAKRHRERGRPFLRDAPVSLQSWHRLVESDPV